MAEEAQAELDLENPNPLHDLVQHALDQDYNKANKVFNDVISVKLNDVLDAEKIKLSNQIYNGMEPGDQEEPEDEDQLELELGDEDGEANEEEEEAASEPTADTESGDEEMETGEEESGEDVEVEVGDEEDEEEKVNN